MMKAERKPATKVTRVIDRALCDMAKCRSLAELEQQFMEQSLSWLPGDCLAWNNWKPDWSSMISGRLNGDYHAKFQSLLEAFSWTVDHHPVIIANQFPSSSTQVLQLSDFESTAKFRDNPLYQEVYRHIDSRHQIAFTPCKLSDRRVLLTLNRRSRDFSESDRSLLWYSGIRLGQAAREIERNQGLESVWNQLCSFADSRIASADVGRLTVSEFKILEMIMKGRRLTGIAKSLGVRRGTLDKKLGFIREKLGVDNLQQLLSMMAELKSKNENAVLMEKTLNGTH